MNEPEPPETDHHLLSRPNPRRMRFAAVAMIMLILESLLLRTLKNEGIHLTKKALTLGAVGMGGFCILGAIIAYRHAKRSAGRHVAELTGKHAREIAEPLGGYAAPPPPPPTI